MYDLIYMNKRTSTSGKEYNPLILFLMLLLVLTTLFHWFPNQSIHPKIYCFTHLIHSDMISVKDNAPIKKLYNSIHVIYGASDNKLEEVAISIISIMNFTQSRVHFHIYVSGKFDRFRRLYNYIESLYKNLKIDLIPFNISRIDELFPYKGRWHKMTFARIFVVEDLKEIERAIYIDNDVFGCGDIKSLNDVDLGTNLMGGAPDSEPGRSYVEKKHLEYFNLTDETYINAGVLLMNMDELRKMHFLELCTKEWNRKKYFYGDQDLINKIIGKRRLVLNRGFNKVFYGGNNITCVLRHFNHIKVYSKHVHPGYLDYDLWYNPLYKFTEINNTFNSLISHQI